MPDFRAYQKLAVANELRRRLEMYVVENDITDSRAVSIFWDDTVIPILVNFDAERALARYEQAHQPKGSRSRLQEQSIAGVTQPRRIAKLLLLQERSIKLAHRILNDLAANWPEKSLAATLVSDVVTMNRADAINVFGIFNDIFPSPCDELSLTLAGTRDPHPVLSENLERHVPTCPFCSQAWQEYISGGWQWTLDSEGNPYNWYKLEHPD